MGLRGTGAGERVTEDERGHGGVCTSTSALSLSGLLAPSPRQEQPNRWIGLAMVGIRNPCSPGEQTLPLCVSSSAPSWSDRHQLRRKESRNNRLGRG